MDGSKFLTPVEAAKEMDLSPRTLERARRVGDGCPFLRLGHRVFYKRDDIAEFMAANRSGREPQKAAG